jgi:hypothetical protein
MFGFDTLTTVGRSCEIEDSAKSMLARIRKPAWRKMEKGGMRFMEVRLWEGFKVSGSMM